MKILGFTDKKFINPLTDISPEDFPVLIFCENSRSLISWAIRIRTGGDKNHVMEMSSLSTVASQGFTGYKEIPLKNFMKAGEKLKFVSLAKAADTQEKYQYFAALARELKESWWKRSYDFLGIFGQLTGLKFINNPWKNFCSERAAEHCRLMEKVKPVIPYKPSPEMLNEALKKIAEVKTLGYWILD